MFSVRLENVDPKLKLTYQWTVYNGEKLNEIKLGQGTPSITITNDKIDFHDKVRVLVEVGGLENGCENKGVIGIIS